MENKEELLKELEKLPEEEKAKIRNLKKLDKKDLEAAAGGLESSTKVALIGLGALAALGGVATVAYKAKQKSEVKNVGSETSKTPLTNASPSDSIERLSDDFDNLCENAGRNFISADEARKEFDAIRDRANALFPDKHIENGDDLRSVLQQFHLSQN